MSSPRVWRLSPGWRSRVRCSPRRALSGNGFDLDTDASAIGCSASGNAVSAVRATGSYAQIEGCMLHGVNGFPVVQVSSSTGVRVERNSLHQGTYAVSADALATGALIVGNQCVGDTSGAFSVPGNNQLGPTVTMGGTILSNSPWANFVR